MLEALIPYIDAPNKTLIDHVPGIGPLKLQFFGPLVMVGLLVGRARCLHYVRRKDVDEELFREYLMWMLIAAFVISHWVSAIFYFPDKVARNPLVLLQIWNGLSSVGGFFGAFVGAAVFLRITCARRRIGAQPIMIFSDISVFGLLAGWCFGRAGCSLVHDHPGQIVPEGTFMAVGPWPDGTWRYDLGLIEFFFALTLMTLVYVVSNWDKWPPGRLTGLVLTVYAPFRFFLDSLRADEAARKVIAVPDERYMGLTPAQWFTMLFLVVGLWLLFVRKASDSEFDYAKESDRQKREQEAADKAKAEAEDDDEADGDEDEDEDEDGADGADEDDEDEA